MSNDEELQAIWDSFPTRVTIRGAYCDPSPDDEFEDCVSAGIVLGFSEKGFGFGEITIRKTPEGIFIDTERMGATKVLEYLAVLVGSAITDVEQDPKLHARYNRAAKSECYAECPLCLAYKAMKEEKP